MILLGPGSAPSRRIPNLANKLRERGYRQSYVTHHVKAFLASQVRALRGARTQREFGARLGKGQSVVSRLEDENYGQVTLQTLFDITKKLDLALIVRFVDFPTFLNFTSDFSESAMAPQSYRQEAVDALAREISEEPRSEPAPAAAAEKKRTGTKPERLAASQDVDSTEGAAARSGIPGPDAAEKKYGALGQ